MKRNQRISYITKKLTEYPSRLFTLNYFSEQLNAAKSSISEDLLIIKEIFSELSIGKVETVIGASGGVMHIPSKSDKEKHKILKDLADKLNSPERKILNEFIYYGDILYQPHTSKDLGEIISSLYQEDSIDYVMTIETKGIPLAMMTANALNVPLVVARKSNKVSEGSTISVHYRSGSSNTILTMYAPKNAMKENSKVLIVDDFLKGGGTVQGMKDLVHEFNSDVVGVTVLIDSINHPKMIDEYSSLLILDSIDGSLEVSVNDSIL